MPINEYYIVNYASILGYIKNELPQISVIWLLESVLFFDIFTK